ncbi:PaaI family thioesterase [Janibacter hoylei]|uniref:Acyl-coenzyme A thioesterase THEM4 n=1 Tax=Janibacter hoylei PVAS-1 TaxID=1210046 RepID=K1DYK2_9MICO|nr:PaaI family thioesterase [Janibacter hoylei]EKA61650.1 thioesterase superfamily protein [Janibacter hoylei PVAS-1]MCW4600869.1 PaaI family thioesterase [Janibacter hoylei]RWU85648.1 PaaI family thioesterase [Janibacter hoylei PVAS-1]
MTDGTFVSPFAVEDPEALAATERVQAELARTTGRLVDAVVRTRVDDATLAEVTAQVEALAGRLLEVAQEGPLGVETASDGRLRDHGNPMVGMRNPIAPPLRVTGDDTGRTTCTFTLGAAYEGPPGCVHGGIVAAVLDQVAGSVPARLGKPGLTAYLNTTYRRPTLLGRELVCSAWVERVDGWKTFVRGDIRDDQGRVTAEVEALFVVPRWAREHVSTPAADAIDVPSAGEETPGSSTP